MAVNTTDAKATTVTHTPVLFMMATATLFILEQLRRITGFTFTKEMSFLAQRRRDDEDNKNMVGNTVYKEVYGVI
jgi:hypothetical protein